DAGSLPAGGARYRACSSPAERRSPKPRQRGFDSFLARQPHRAPAAIGNMTYPKSVVTNCNESTNALNIGSAEPASRDAREEYTPNTPGGRCRAFAAQARPDQ